MFNYAMKVLTRVGIGVLAGCAASYAMFRSLDFADEVMTITGGLLFGWNCHVGKDSPNRSKTRNWLGPTSWSQQAGHEKKPKESCEPGRRAGRGLSPIPAVNHFTFSVGSSAVRPTTSTRPTMLPRLSLTGASTETMPLRRDTTTRSPESRTCFISGNIAWCSAPHSQNWLIS